MGIEYGEWKFGILRKGKRNLITDVPGVMVGHVTKADGSIQTGITAILPHKGNLFQNKLLAAAHVINGFGKSTGLIQIQELGTIETPIVLTNTFSVSAGIDGILDYMLPDNPDIGTTTCTINPVVLECNDGRLNDIRGRHLTSGDVVQAIKNASAQFQEGAIGGGRGMCCYGLKGGIGSSSRIVSINTDEYTVGCLVMTNFGSPGDLTICGEQLEKSTSCQRDKGSVIIVLATDLPLSTRQLNRCIKRAQNGLACTGSITGTGSGEIVLMFSTANHVPHYPKDSILAMNFLHEDMIDVVFRSVAECTEESVISSLMHAESVTGIQGHTINSLKDSGLIEWI